jgi:hypothetical protein
MTRAARLSIVGAARRSARDPLTAVALPVIGQRFEEALPDLGAPAHRTEHATLLLRRDGHEPRHRLRATRDHDLLAR